MKALITVYQTKHAFAPLGFPSWSLGHFLLSVFPAAPSPQSRYDLRGGGGSTLDLAVHSTVVEFTIEVTFVHIPICENALCQLLLTFLDPGRPKNQNFQKATKKEAKGFCKRPKKRPKRRPKKGVEKGGMLRRLIEILWLLLVVSSHIGEALTCYSCGPHSDQVREIIEE